MTELERGVNASDGAIRRTPNRVGSADVYRVYPYLEGFHSCSEAARALTDAQFEGRISEEVDPVDLGLSHGKKPRLDQI